MSYISEMITLYSKIFGMPVWLTMLAIVTGVMAGIGIIIERVEKTNRDKAKLRALETLAASVKRDDAKKNTQSET